MKYVVFCSTLLPQFCNVLLHVLYLGYKTFASHWGSWQRYHALSARMRARQECTYRGKVCFFSLSEIGQRNLYGPGKLYPFRVNRMRRICNLYRLPFKN